MFYSFVDSNSQGPPETKLFNSEPSPHRKDKRLAHVVTAGLGDTGVLSELKSITASAFDEKSSVNCDAIDDGLSSVSHGLATKLQPAKEPVQASMMKSRMNGEIDA